MFLDFSCGSFHIYSTPLPILNLSYFSKLAALLRPVPKHSTPLSAFLLRLGTRGTVLILIPPSIPLTVHVLPTSSSPILPFFFTFSSPCSETSLLRSMSRFFLSKHYAPVFPPLSSSCVPVFRLSCEQHLAAFGRSKNASPISLRTSYSLLRICLDTRREAIRADLNLWISLASMYFLTTKNVVKRRRKLSLKIKILRTLKDEKYLQ